MTRPMREAIIILAIVSIIGTGVLVITSGMRRNPPPPPNTSPQSHPTTPARPLGINTPSPTTYIPPPPPPPEPVPGNDLPDIFPELHKDSTTWKFDGGNVQEASIVNSHAAQSGNPEEYIQKIKELVAMMDVHDPATTEKVTTVYFTGDAAQINIIANRAHANDDVRTALIARAHILMASANDMECAKGIFGLRYIAGVTVADIPTLKQLCLERKFPKVQSECIVSLGMLKDTKSLLDVLYKSSEAGAVADALDALIRLDMPTAPDIIAAMHFGLTHPENFVRQRALLNLHHRNGPSILNEQILADVQRIAAEDPYALVREGVTKYPLRENAKTLLDNLNR